MMGCIPGSLHLCICVSLIVMMVMAKHRLCVRVGILLTNENCAGNDDTLIVMMVMANQRSYPSISLPILGAAHGLSLGWKMQFLIMCNILAEYAKYARYSKCIHYLVR